MCMAAERAAQPLIDSVSMLDHWLLLYLHHGSQSLPPPRKPRQPDYFADYAAICNYAARLGRVFPFAMQSWATPVIGGLMALKRSNQCRCIAKYIIARRYRRWAEAELAAIIGHDGQMATPLLRFHRLGMHRWPLCGHADAYHQAKWQRSRVNGIKNRREWRTSLLEDASNDGTTARHSR